MQLHENTHLAWQQVSGLSLHAHFGIEKQASFFFLSFFYDGLCPRNLISARYYPVEVFIPIKHGYLFFFFFWLLY